MEVENVLETKKVIIFGDSSSNLWFNLQKEKLKMPEKEICELFTKPIQNFIQEILAKLKRQKPEQLLLNMSKENKSASKILDYFVNEKKIEEILSTSYVPSKKDLIMYRQISDGMCNTELNYPNLKLSFLDVGSQLHYRKVWKKAFQNVDVVFFVANINTFDHYKGSVNQLQKSIIDFKKTVNGEWFCDTKVLLILTGVKEFCEKIKNSDNFSSIFKDYAGGKDYSECINFIKNKFMGSVKNSQVKCIVTTELEDHCNLTLILNYIFIEFFDKDLSDVRKKTIIEYPGSPTKSQGSPKKMSSSFGSMSFLKRRSDPNEEKIKSPKINISKRSTVDGILQVTFEERKNKSLEEKNSQEKPKRKLSINFIKPKDKPKEKEPDKMKSFIHLKDFNGDTNQYFFPRKSLKFDADFSVLKIPP